MLTIKKKNTTQPCATADKATADKIKTLADASFEVLVESMKTSVVVVLERPREDGMRGMATITAVTIVPTEYAREYADRALGIHEKLIDQFMAECRLENIKKELNEDGW